MLELVNDSTTTKRFAAHTVDAYARCLAGIDDRPAPAGVLGVVSGGCSKGVASESKFGGRIPHRPYRFGGLEFIGIVAFVGHLGRTRLHYLGFSSHSVGSERNHVRSLVPGMWSRVRLLALQ